jgi:predicted secreted protein
MIEIGFIFGAAIYGLIWFLTLFMVLPFGVVSQHETGEIVPGTEGGAPAQPRILKKLFYTTLLASAFYAVAYWALTSGALANAELPFCRISVRNS